MSAVIRVFIAEDHPIVRRGIRDLLETEADIQVVGEADNGRDAVSEVEELQPDVVLMDLLMPEMDGIEAIRQLRERSPAVRFLVLTSFATDDKVFPAIKAGALGYLIKDTAPEDLIQAIHQVYRGEPSLQAAIAQKVLNEISSPAKGPPSAEPLTAREVEVLKYIAQGLNNQEIAEALVISVATVYTHVSNILSKLHLASRTQAALYALREGYASLYESDSDELPKG
ncbi:MAG: response regulator transcription factor [Anaerolineales bacterium]|jgi:NarL family two-component system response regulator LiaR